jgi:glucokinase
MILLCDIGGTHIRCGISEDGQNLRQVIKARACDFDTFYEALNNYCRAIQISAPITDMRISLAARSADQEKWVFTHSNPWVIEANTLKKLYPLKNLLLVNDFHANALGIAGCEASLENFESWQKTKSQESGSFSSTVIGVGTGCGLCYFRPHKTHQNHFSFQETFGGHMVPVMITKEQRKLISFIYKFRKDEKKKATVSTYEDVLSGEGLFATYHFLCEESHLAREYLDSTQLFLNGKDDPLFHQAIDMFCDFLGLFAHQAIMFGHGFRHLYLTGGVIDRLVLAGLLNRERFFSSFIQNNVTAVKESFMNMGISWVADEYIALKGLLLKDQIEANGV